MEVKDLKVQELKTETKINGKNVVLALRITEKDKAMLDALSDFLGTSKVEILMTFLEEAYAQNKEGIELMLKKRAEAKAKSKK